MSDKTIFVVVGGCPQEDQMIIGATDNIHVAHETMARYQRTRFGQYDDAWVKEVTLAEGQEQLPVEDILDKRIALRDRDEK